MDFEKGFWWSGHGLSLGFFVLWAWIFTRGFGGLGLDFQKKVLLLPKNFVLVQGDPLLVQEELYVLVQDEHISLLQ